MVKILKCLLILNLLTWSNVYAWYCTYTPTDNGYISEGSTQCYGIDVDTAIETVWCTTYQPSDPICKNYVSCSDQTEQRSIACTDPNTTGLVNESRVYSCNTDSWSSWSISSNNCVPLPKTCFESVEEKALECQDGYTGSILQQRSISCSTDYAAPITGPWITLKDSCIPKAQDPKSIESPLNPASPLSMDQQKVEPLGSPLNTVDTKPNPIKETPTNPMVQPELVRQEIVQTPKKVEKKQQKKEAPKTKKNEEVIPGFGIAISFELIEQPIIMQQQQMNNILNLTQDQNYAREQDLLIDLIQSDDYSIAFGELADSRWRSLLRDFPLQQDAFSN